MPHTDEYMAANAREAYERICAMASEGIEAMLANRTLSERNCELELENQRLQFELKAQRDLKLQATHRNMDLHRENERLLDLLAGRIERGPVDPKLLLRSVLNVVHSAAGSEEGDYDSIS